MTREEYWKEKREAEHYMKAEEQEMRKNCEYDGLDLFLDFFSFLILFTIFGVFCVGVYHLVKMIIG
jgi:hypothetical protein